MSRTPARALVRDIEEGVDDVQRAATRAGSHIVKDAREAIAGAVSESKDLAQRASAAAKARPGATLAVAAAFGALIAFLLAPRRRRR